MPDPKALDHWRQVAQLLGAPVPEEPVPAAPPPEPAKEPEPVAEPAVTRPEAARPPKAVVAETSQAPVTAPAVPETPPPPPAPPAVSPAKPVAAEPRPRPARPRNHWIDLAGQLGIEVAGVEEPTEPEPEPVAEAKPEPKPEPPRTMGFDWEEVQPPPAEEPVSAATKREAPERLESPTRDALAFFEDPNLSVETPGVLDAIFDEAAAEPSEAEPDSGADADAEADADAWPEPAPRDASPDRAMDQDQPARRKRRRRGRRRRGGGPPDREAATGEFRQLPAEDDFLSEAPEETEEDTEVQGRDDLALPASAEEAGPPRGRHARRWQSADEEPLEEAAEDEFDEDAGRAWQPEPVGAQDEHPDHEHDDDLDAGLDDEDSESFHIKHRNIPTWEEAVSAVIATNMEARAKNPNGGSRGRGRGRNRR